MAIRRGRCQRCGQYFTPRQRHHRYCDTCHRDTAPMGWTTYRRRPGAAARRHGGISRLWAGRPLILRRNLDSPKDQPSDTTVTVLEGLRDFFTDLYRHPTRMSAFLRQAGLSQSELASLKYGPSLDSLLMRFCPKLREWLIETIGMKAADVIIEFYGLYGDKRRRIADIASDLGLTKSHARALRGWALKRLRGMEAQAALKELGASVARGVLKTK
ncbi:MAG: hypothetical protein ACETWR_21765 [Anaerolineae bacterium]